MRRLLAASALALALGAGTASADTFAVVQDAPVVLPSSDTPNEVGSVLLPPGVFEAPFLPVRELAYEELQALWLRAGAVYGIPWQVLAAINKIESNFGRNMGPSSAGAVGWMQFMPDTWLRWGTDGNGDGIADPWNAEDGVYSAARYLAAAGGRTDVSRSIFAYNHAQWYVDDVLQLAELFGGGGGADVVFSLDRMAVAVEDAQAHVATLSEQLRQAEQRETELAGYAAELTRAAESLGSLLSDRLLAQQAAFRAEAARAEADDDVEALRAELEQWQTTLESARSGAHAASFMPAAAGVLQMPTAADGYVFPVGGGPAVVSVGPDHHDYPAADIAAPLGAPVYALADAIVLDVVDDSRCGIGLTLRTLDGLEWVYCHLSHREASVQPGAVVTAGQWVGLVGSTGRSTGPHLHLGLRPARYPQEMPWFQELAGIAFTWQDSTPAGDSMPGSVFAVVPAAADPSEEVIEFTLTGS
jgi:murein DD-endopeptidase MepM/ murein hydrolase activator NlpD